MKTLLFKNNEEWLAARRGKITGTRLGDLTPNQRTGAYKIGYYDLIAEIVALPPTEESAMDRGHRLEDEALSRFEKETGKLVNKSLQMWVRDDNDSIAVSPDGSIETPDGATEAVEVKCLKSGKHIEALLTKTIPKEYEEQIIQYFCVNDDLQQLHFVFYDPRMPKDFFYYTIGRNNMAEKVSEYLEMQKRVLIDIQSIVDQLTF